MNSRVNETLTRPEVLRDLAISSGVCVRPIMQRLTDTQTGEARIVPIPCGATLESKCPSCADRARRLRIQQCREGWHLTDEPTKHTEDEPADQQRDEAQGQEDEEEHGGEGQADENETSAPLEGGGATRSRSTRRRQDAPDLPRLPMAKTTVGRTFVGKDGTVYRPSTFLTVTMPSYGKVLPDGTPEDPSTYDYRRAALDALHASKLWDRLVQSMRRCVGYDVQYFAAVEPQRRLAPHTHAAIRGTFPRAVLREVVAATYYQLWWPAHDEPVYTDHYPTWQEFTDGGGAYIDPDTATFLPTFDQALDRMDEESDPEPAHVLRYGTQIDIQGLIGGPKADKAVGYLCKYLTKSIAEGAIADGADQPSYAQDAHVERLYQEVRYLPCSPECCNWLRYGIAPRGATPGMTPGYCPRRAHRRETLGCGGRRVLVSRKWTGKTLDQHRADRREAVRTVLEAAGIDLPDGATADETRDDGQPRWRWEPIDPTSEPVPVTEVLSELITQRTRWRQQYEQARDRLAHQSPVNSSIEIHPPMAA